MHGLQSIAHIGQGAADNHTHGVVEVRLTHLIFNVDVNNVVSDYCHGLCGIPSKIVRNGQLTSGQASRLKPRRLEPPAVQFGAEFGGSFSSIF